MPLITLGSFAAGCAESAKYFNQFPRLLIIIGIDGFLSLGITVFCIYAGVGLWRIRRGAVRLAKRYLLCFLVYQAVAVTLPFFAGLPPAANEAMIVQVVKDTLRSIIYFTVWYLYLTKSRRVRATYAE
jgi:hypothetical protein